MPSRSGKSLPSSDWIVFFEADVEEGQADTSEACKRKLVNAIKESQSIKSHRLEILETYSKCIVVRWSVPKKYNSVMSFVNRKGIAAGDVKLTPLDHDDEACAGPSAASAGGPCAGAGADSEPSQTLPPAIATPRMTSSAASANELASAATASAQREAPGGGGPVNVASMYEQHEWPRMATAKLSSLMRCMSTCKPLDRSSLGTRLGKGAYGSVYKSQLKDEPVALKILDGQWKIPSAVTEVNAYCNLPPHPNVMQLLDVGVAGPYTIVLTFPLFERTLGVELRKGPVATPENLLFITASLVAGLGHIHSHGFLHGDIKPSNILMNGASYPMAYSWTTFASEMAKFGQTICLSDLGGLEAAKPCFRHRDTKSDLVFFGIF